MVWIIAPICSIGIGDLGFFGIADTDYSETARVTSVRKLELRGSLKAVKPVGNAVLFIGRIKRHTEPLLQLRMSG
jgi:hypothetical protein